MIGSLVDPVILLRTALCHKAWVEGKLNYCYQAVSREILTSVSITPSYVTSSPANKREKHEASTFTGHSRNHGVSGARTRDTSTIILKDSCMFHCANKASLTSPQQWRLKRSTAHAHDHGSHVASLSCLWPTSMQRMADLWLCDLLSQIFSRDFYGSEWD